MIRILLVSLIFIFSCEKNLITSNPIWGCTDKDACNYDSGANRDDESCIFSEDGYDCDGICIEETSDGCECGILIDECGECGGGGPEDHYDCDDNCISELDCLGQCGGDASEDCMGECNGGAIMDCSGICNGTALEDCYGICNGGAIEDVNQNCCDISELTDCGICSGLEEYNIPDSWTVIFEDNFDGLEVDQSIWKIENWEAGRYNQEQQAYTSRSDNLYIENGSLVIRALRENYTHIDTVSGIESPAQYTSARLNTKSNIDFGPLDCGSCGGGEIKVEVRAKLPDGNGTWPAIWMLPTYDVYGGWPSSGEIDLMEHAPGTTGINNILSSLHTDSYNFTENTQISETVFISDATTNYLTYTLNWMNGSLYMEIYNEETLESYSSVSFSDNGQGPASWPFDQQFHLLLNLAIGGNMGGSNIDNGSFPQHFYIDYVRVSQRGCIE